MSKDKWNDKFIADIYKKMAAGLSDTQVMALWDVSRGTFYRWLKEHPELKDAHERGIVAFDAIHEDYGVQGMLGQSDIKYPFWRDLMKFRHGWTEKPVSTGNTQINIDTMNVLNQQTNEELAIYIKTQLEQNPELLTVLEGQIVE